MAVTEGNDDFMETHPIDLHTRTLRRWARIRLVHAGAVLISAAVTVGMAIAGSQKVWVPMMFMAAALAAMGVLRIGRWRATHTATRTLASEEGAARVRSVGIRTITAIMLALVSGAVFVTLALTDREHALIAFIAAFCALAIFGGPVWLASVGDEEAEEREELDQAESRRNRGS
jgi:hypothetical protein